MLTSYRSGFVFFVTTLQAGHFKFQFTQFAWTHMALYLIVVQAHFIMNNVFEGMIWFFLPATLVITNDIFAYVVGITFGRTQLIKLSPKKTVEGFVGAWIMTLVGGVVTTKILMRSNYFICPVNVIQPSPLSKLTQYSHGMIPELPLLTASRISPLIFLPVSNANPTLFFCPSFTAFPISSSSLPTLTSPSPSRLFSSTPSFWPPLLPSSRPLAVSLPLA